MSTFHYHFFHINQGEFIEEGKSPGMSRISQNLN